MQDDGVAPTIATRQLPRSGFVQGALCRVPDYADQRGQTGLGGADFCEGCGIILVI